MLANNKTLNQPKYLVMCNDELDKFYQSKTVDNYFTDYIMNW